MAGRIEDYAVIGDMHTVALVGRDGAMDWLCLPRFDSPACFAALLGGEENGHWKIAPGGGVRRVRRRYRRQTLVLETDFETAEGTVRLVDFMPPRTAKPAVVRVVEGVRGRVSMNVELMVRFDYGSIVPWVRRLDGAVLGVGGPDAVRITSPVALQGEHLRHTATFDVAAGDSVPFVLQWFPSFERSPRRLDAADALARTEAFWDGWSARCRYEGTARDSVLRSLVTLKALTYAPTGGIVAAGTTSLPEQLGGVRNWDYRFCWLRDATFTLYALHLGGYTTEARAWRNWLLRAVAGRPEKMQIMYGPRGERRLAEAEVDWLAGYQGARPVRIGNAAVEQFQLDVYGEVMDAFYQARHSGIHDAAGDERAWALQRAIMDFLESGWEEPDEGIWEVRGPRRHFTHSKVMAWVAADRAVPTVDHYRTEGPVERWRRLRQEGHDEVCRGGYDPDRATFTQYYGSVALDASLLLLPLVGFLPASDSRVQGTVAAIEGGLLRDGFVQRYSPESSTGVDGLPAGEGVFLACSFWLADNYSLMGRKADARKLFRRLVGLANDVGLLSEEYDPDTKRLVGNYPQAFSHVSLVNTAYNLGREGGVALARHTCGHR